LYKLVHPSAAVRDDAVALLKAVAALELGGGGGGGGGGEGGDGGSGGGSGGGGGAKDTLAEIFSQDTLPELPDAYQAFQQGVSRQLARQRPRLGEELLVEALHRQMDDGAADAGAHRHVLAALAPWVAALHLPHIAAAGRAERLLKSLYFVTYFRGDALPREIETLWRHIGRSPRNVVPALRFLETKGLEDTSSAAAMSTYCLTAKRVCLYLARAVGLGGGARNVSSSLYSSLLAADSRFTRGGTHPVETVQPINATLWFQGGGVRVVSVL
jgi:hypothetical protein